MSYGSRLIAGIGLVLVVTVLVLVVGVDRLLRHDLERETEASLHRAAALIRDALPEDSLVWQAAVRRAAASTGLRVTLIDRTGRVRAESDEAGDDLSRIENHGARAEVAAALAGRPGTDRRTSATVGDPFLYLALPGRPGAVRVAASLEGVEAIIARAERQVLVVALVALLLGVPLALVAARRFSRPLAEIAGSARAIARGESPRFPYSGIPDIDRVTADLRAMHEQLAERFESLRRRQSETAAIVDSMVEGVLSSDSRGHITTANPAARRLLGFAEGDPLPDLPLLLRGKDARDAIATVLAGEPVSDREMTIGDRTCLFNARPLPTGGAVVVLHDLTHLRRLEVVRRDFVANVSHELKTPLTAISGYSETLLSDQPGPETAKRFLETILANARRMQRLVDDQLDLSRIESGSWTPVPEPTGIEGIAREAWLLARPEPGSAPTLAIALSPGAREVVADPDALRQIFRNLFENAIRHTPPRGTVTVSAAGVDGGTRITVSDTGTGIASEHLPRIFERFYRVDPSRSREQGGTGLGLAIVKHLVEGQGGRVWAESDLGRGTSIHLFLPTAEATG